MAFAVGDGGSGAQCCARIAPRTKLRLVPSAATHTVARTAKYVGVLAKDGAVRDAARDAVRTCCVQRTRRNGQGTRPRTDGSADSALAPDECEKLCSQLNFDQLEGLCSDLEAVIAAKGAGTLDALRKRLQRELPSQDTLDHSSQNGNGEPQTSRDEPSPAEAAPADSRKSPWTEQELTLLTKGANKFPGGVPDRWIKIAEFINHLVRGQRLAAGGFSPSLGG
eukprot:5123656-Pleurochrysis_carterae.AAC.1